MQYSRSLRPERGTFDQLRITLLFTLHQVDQLEVTLRMALVSLGSVRNAFSPINILPREVLAHIFSLVSDDNPIVPPSLPDLSVRKSPYGWIVATLVCKHWRETALAFPALWSTVDSHRPFAALAFLERSAACSLRVYLRDAVHDSRIVPSLERARFMQSVAHHSARFTELHIQPHFRYGPSIINALQYPAPLLKALSIMLNIGQDDGGDLPKLFGGHTPNLERLTLANFVSWSGNDFGSKLTHLCLFDQHHRGRMLLDDFLDFLGSLPRLEELILVNAGPTTSFTSSRRDASQMVNFPMLRILHLGCWPSPQSTAQFLSHIAIPHSTTMHIWADCLFRRDETLSTLLPSDLSHLQPLHNLKAIHLVYRPALREYPQLISAQDGVLVFYFFFATSLTTGMVSSVFECLNVHGVTKFTLGIECDPELPSEAWKNVFSALPHLQDLNIIRRPSRPILAALVQERSEDDVLCPELSTLAITEDRVISSIILFLFAESRAQRGLPLHNLRIVSTVHSRMTGEMDELKRHVANVEHSNEEPKMIAPVGWPTDIFLWIAGRRDARARRW